MFRFFGCCFFPPFVLCIDDGKTAQAVASSCILLAFVPKTISQPTTIITKSLSENWCVVWRPQLDQPFMGEHLKWENSDEKKKIGVLRWALFLAAIYGEITRRFSCPNFERNFNIQTICVFSCTKSRLHFHIFTSLLFRVISCFLHESRSILRCVLFTNDKQSVSNIGKRTHTHSTFLFCVLFFSCGITCTLLRERMRIKIERERERIHEQSE